LELAARRHRRRNQWPTPEKLLFGGFTTYVYHNEVMLLVPLKLANDLPAGPLELKAKVSWLECEELCVPGSQNVKRQAEHRQRNKTLHRRDADRKLEEKNAARARGLGPVRNAAGNDPGKHTRPFIIE